MDRIAIYLAGNIKKSHEQLHESFWGEPEMAAISAALQPVQVDFLHPGLRSDDLSDQKSVFGRDMTQVYCSNVVFVDARQRRGLGVGAEMMWAKMNSIPVVTLCPLEAHYQKSQIQILDVSVNNWVHPFIANLSDFVAPTLEAGAEWIHSFFIKKHSHITIKGPKYIKEAMAYYRESQFGKDHSMQALTQENFSLYERMHSFID